MGAYKQDVPNRNYALKALAKSFGKERADKIWNQACREASVNGNPSNMQELENVYDAISSMNGAAGVTGKSLKVRLITYRTLN